MKIYSNVSDKPKKKKLGNDTDDLNTKVRNAAEEAAESSGTGASVQRNKKGLLQRIQGANYQGVTTNTMAADKSRMKGNKQFNSGVAPRVGGDGNYKSDAGASGLSGTVSKKQLRQSNRNINNNSASPQAKKAAKRANKRMY